MTAIPARVAGVGEVVVTTPGLHATGAVDGWTLAACHVSGVSRLFKVGGAQAVAALAYGTATVPAVDKICGPGNAYVAAAKRLVFGQVDIDMIAGPSEILVLADGEADAAEVASDLLAQAEHDVRAVAVLVTPSKALAAAVRAEVARQLGDLPRREIAGRAIAERGAVVVTRTLAEAVRLADEFAPEHLAVHAADARAAGAEARPRRGRLRRRLDARGGGRLPGRPEPRAPHRRHGPLRLAALGGHLPAAPERARVHAAGAGRGGAGGRGAGPGRGAGGPLARRRGCGSRGRPEGGGEAGQGAEAARRARPAKRPKTRSRGRT